MKKRQAIQTFVLGALAFAAGLPAQEALDGEPFSEVVDVRVVNIEVVVTDRQGVPVRGLDAGAFILEVDGNEVPIDYFSEIRGGEVLAEPGGGVSDLPSIPAVVPGEPVATSYLVFVDDYFTFKEDRDRVLDGIEQDLALLGENDRMAIVAFDGRQLEMLTSWTGSRAALERALDAARSRPTHGLMRLAELREYERSASARPGGGGRPGFDLDPDTKSFILRLGDQIDRMLRGAAATLRGFGNPPGRKVMVMINGGWPFSPTEFVAADYRGSTELSLVERDQLFDQVTEAANLLGYTVYPADASGQGTRWLEDPAAAARVEPGDSGLYTARRVGRQYSSRYVAQQTGGRALLYEDAERAFGNAVADTRSYYWLGFSPTLAWDDRAHDIRVRTRDGELEVRTRQGFLDSSRETEVTHQVESVFLFGEGGQESPLEVSLGDSRRAGFRKAEIPLTVSIPMDVLTFVPHEDGVAAALELRLAVEDQAYRRAEIPVIPIRIEGAERPGPEDHWEYTVPLVLRRQKHRGLVALYDVVSGRMFTSDVVIDP